MRFYLELEDLREGDDGGGEADDDDDEARSSRRAPDLAAHRMADADVALDGERDRQPDAGVGAGVAEPGDVRPQPDVQRTGRGRAVVLLQRDDEHQRQVEHVVDGQRRQVVVRRRLHRAARQHGDVEHVADHAERDDDRHQDALDDEPRRRQLRGQRRRAAVGRAASVPRPRHRQ